jgi:CxxC-x17-CxxC domain-containing protein
MGNFNRGGGFGGKKRFDNDRGGGGFRGDRGDRLERPQMFQAICSECGKECSVPFKPTGSKPVFCSNCFGKKEGGSNGNRFDRRDSSRSSFGDKPMFKAVCDKCGKDCEVPFRPTGDKPVFCSDCFSKSDRGTDRGSSKNSSSGQSEKQFVMLNDKLDILIKLLSPKAATKTVVEKTTKLKKVAPPKKIVKKISKKKK